MSEVFLNIGIGIKHEAIGRDGMISWYATGTKDEKRKDIDIFKIRVRYYMKSNPIVLHQVREPLASIKSIDKAFGKHAFAYVDKQIAMQFSKPATCGTTLKYVVFPKIVDYNTRLEWVMLYWLYWNKLAERDAIWRYKIEDVKNEDFFKTFCEKVKMPYKNSYMTKKITFKGKHHPRSDRRRLWDRNIVVTWDTLFTVNEKLARDVVEQGRRYGYES